MRIDCPTCQLCRIHTAGGNVLYCPNLLPCPVGHGAVTTYLPALSSARNQAASTPRQGVRYSKGSTPSGVSDRPLFYYPVVFTMLSCVSIDIFLTECIFIYRRQKTAVCNTMTIQDYDGAAFDPYSNGTHRHRRQYRELSDDTKRRISASATGKHKTAEHRQHIAQGMQKYWQTVPHRPEQSDPTGTQGYTSAGV